MGDLDPRPTTTDPSALDTTPWKTLGRAAGGFLGGPVGSALGGMAAQAAVDYLSPQSKALREQSRKDIAALQKGKLGFSEAEKRTMLAGTQRALQAQTAGVEANLRRQAAAAGGFGRSGAQTNALRGIAAAQGEKLVQGQANIDALSQQQAQQRFKSIMEGLANKRSEQMQRAGTAGEALSMTPAASGVAYRKAKAGTTDETVGYAKDRPDINAWARRQQAAAATGGMT